MEERYSQDRKKKQQAPINSQRILLMCVSVLSPLIMLLCFPNVYYLIQPASRNGCPVFRIKSPEVVCEGSREVCSERSPGSGRVVSRCVSRQWESSSTRPLCPHKLNSVFEGRQLGTKAYIQQPPLVEQQHCVGHTRMKETQRWESENEAHGEKDGERERERTEAVV